MRRKEMSKTQTIMNTIKWINDTFVPRGLKPIEDLPQAMPGDGYSCVIAMVLHSNPKWEHANVSTSSINLALQYEYSQDTYDNDKLYNEEVMAQLVQESYIDIPEEVRQFIADFDRGDYPELLNIEGVKETLPYSEFRTTLLENYYAWSDRKEEKV